jgi:hypothetical protein
MHHPTMDRWLLLSRGWYLLLAVGALGVAAGGIGGAIATTPAVAAAVVGILSLSSAAWVHSPSIPRGALASIGIPTGASAVVAAAFLWATVVDTLGVLPGAAAYVAAAVPSGLAITAAAILWRHSARPWNEPPSEG